MKINFRCTACGLCCKNIHMVKALDEFHNGDGICKFLDLNTNHCMIYDGRPDICNVERSYDLFYSDIMTEEEYVERNYEGCKILWQEKRL